MGSTPSLRIEEEEEEEEVKPFRKKNLQVKTSWASVRKRLVGQLVVSPSPVDLYKERPRFYLGKATEELWSTTSLIAPKRKLVLARKQMEEIPWSEPILPAVPFLLVRLRKLNFRVGRTYNESCFIAQVAVGDYFAWTWRLPQSELARWKLFEQEE